MNIHRKKKEASSLSKAWSQWLTPSTRPFSQWIHQRINQGCTSFHDPVSSQLCYSWGPNLQYLALQKDTAYINHSSLGKQNCSDHDVSVVWITTEEQQQNSAASILPRASSSDLWTPGNIWVTLICHSLVIVTSCILPYFFLLPGVTHD